MPFVKLDCGILNSTIWYDPPALKLFVTALLMAEPFEVIEPTPTIQIGSLEPGDYVVPTGWYGFVPSSGPGLIYRALMKDDEGEAALVRLASVEKGSRSRDHDGRRLVRVDGGFIVLNFQKFRDRDYTNAERQARWRDRRKSESNDVTSRSNPVTITPVTQAEAEAEADKSNTLVHSHSENVVSPKRARYAADFEEFWMAFSPPSRRLGKAPASRAWARLSADDRKKAVDTLPTFKEANRGKEDRHIVIASTYLVQRRFDDFDGVKPLKDKGRENYLKQMEEMKHETP